MIYILMIFCACIIIAEVFRNKDNAQKSSYEEEKKLEEQKENERKYGKNRFSRYFFPIMDTKGRYLKYKYYDVEVKGTQYTDFDITQIPIDTPITFEFEPDNQYDKNAIKVICKDMFIGYIPKTNLQEMLKKFIESETKVVEAFIKRVNEESKYIEIGIGFYVELTKEELAKIPHIDSTLTKMKKKDEYMECSRQDNLIGASIGDEVDLDYNADTETYIVTYGAGEIGEISKSNTEKLHDVEYECKELQSVILELNDEDIDDMSCKIRTFIVY